MLERIAEQRFKNVNIENYRPYIRALTEDSPLSKVRDVREHEQMALAMKLMQFDMYRQYLNEAGTAAELGILPNLALDIITAVQGASIIPLISSDQPIQEEQGTIYYKQSRIASQRGSWNVGDVLKDPRQYNPGLENYASEQQTAALGNTVATQLSYTGTLSVPLPVRPNSVYITVADLPDVYGRDDGQGYIIGRGVQGTIDYASGDWELAFLADPAGAYAMSMQVGSDYEAGAEIPKITTVMESTDIKAEIFVLSSETGLFKSFTMEQRWGTNAREDMVGDLTDRIIEEVGNTLVSRIIAAAPAANKITWDRSHTGISWNEHKLSFVDTIAESEAKILSSAGRGTVNVLLSSPEVCAIMNGLPSFKSAGATGSGPQVYGYLDNKLVIRVPGVTPNKAWALYQGTGHFDTVAVYSTYMPLFVTGSIPGGTNLLQTRGLAAIWSGIKVVCPNFISEIEVVQS